MKLPSADFESAASASSAIPAWEGNNFAAEQPYCFPEAISGVSRSVLCNLSIAQPPRGFQYSRRPTPSVICDLFFAELGILLTAYHGAMLLRHYLAGSLLGWLVCLVLALVPAPALAGDVAAFDLIGPRMEVTVTRTGRTLPIAEVPNLQAGDRVWIHPALPDDQRARYLMVVAFLRGATNPPPDAWFTRAETWSKLVREEGIVVTVPKDAQQALIFLAPQTGGDFATLRSAVQGKPGAFVRAAQDLQLISLNRARLEKYLAAIRDSDERDPKALHERALTLARSLSIKVDENCFSRPVLQQASCLMQNSDQLVLDDGHGESMVSALTEGAGSDLLGAISTTKVAGGGAYSPYVGVVVDLARLMENLHTAKYQYISALALPQGDELHLRLNYPPSFHKPQSVIVIGLPVVQPPVPPALHPVPAEAVNCAQNPSLVLGADGAPLVFSSELAHHLTLHLENKDGKSVGIPVVANALQGGFVPTAPVPDLNWLPLAFTGKVHGQWGFESFDGPTYKLQRSDPSTQWTVPDDDKTVSIAGHARTLRLRSGNSVCVEEIGFRPAKGDIKKTTWKPMADALEVHLPLEQAPAGDSALLLKQYGVQHPSELPLHVYEEACRLDEFLVHAGDSQGVLKGSCLDRVNSLDVAGMHWKVESSVQVDSLRMRADGGDPLILHEAQSVTARVALKDGRVLEVRGSILPPRPRLQLMSKVVEPSASPIHLGSQDDLPVDARLHFRLKSEQPSVFGRAEKVEVASADGFYHTELSLENGGLMRQNAHTVMATLEIPRVFGASSFGALRFRPVSAEGYEGDWQPLATLVRLPELSELHCPSGKDEPCALSGTNLFLIESISADPEFLHAEPVSENAMAASVEVPRPKGKLLYVRLRDDPSVVHTLEMPMKKDAPAAHKEGVPKDERPASAAAASEKGATPAKAADSQSSR